MKLINFDKETFGSIGQKVASAAQNGLARSKKLAEIAKLKAANISEEESMKRAYTEIGKLYFAEHGTAPEGAYVALCSRISKSRDTIQQNLITIEELKSAPEVTEADFDDQTPAAEPEESEKPAAEVVEDAAPAEEQPAAEPVEAEPAAEEVVEPAPAEETAEEPIPDEE